MGSRADLADRWPPRDRIGRQQPHRFALPSFLGQPSGIGMTLAEAYKQRVPDEFCAADVDEDGDAIHVIACPCGEEPIVYSLRSVECECGRFYLNIGTEVRVFRPEGVEPGTPRDRTPA